MVIESGILSSDRSKVRLSDGHSNEEIVLTDESGQSFSLEELAEQARKNQPLLMHSIIPISETEETGVCHTVGMNLNGMPDLVVYGFDEDRSRQLIEYTYSTIGLIDVSSDFYPFQSPMGQTLYLVDVDTESRYCKSLHRTVWGLMEYGLSSGLIKDKTPRIKQIVLPDHQGKYPWNDTCASSVRGMPYLGYTNGSIFNDA